MKRIYYMAYHRTKALVAYHNRRELWLKDNNDFYALGVYNENLLRPFFFKINLSSYDLNSIHLGWWSTMNYLLTEAIEVLE